MSSADLAGLGPTACAVFSDHLALTLDSNSFNSKAPGQAQRLAQASDMSMLWGEGIGATLEHRPSLHRPLRS